jgi:predicted MFS family arabinose efflux permease
MESTPADRINGSTWRAVAAALLAILVGIGLSRFAYSPLIPAVVEARWFSPGEAAYLGAANLAGYLIGALGGRRLAAWSSPVTALRVLMLAASLAFVASAFPLSFGWFFLWRLVSGITGGALMVLAAPTVLPHVPAARRGLAAGAIFAGVGLGIILSGTLVPALLVHGLPTTWFALAGLSFAATGLAWFWWPATDAAATGPAAAADTGLLRQPALIPIYASYGLIAVGLVPHMVFLVDFVARGLGQGIAVGGRYWVLFGIGALLGPLLAGRLADRLGFDRALRTVLVVHIASAALLAFDHSAAALAISSLFIGSAVSGTVPLVLGQTQQRVLPADLQKTAWGIATATFALGQAGGGYAYSFLFAATGGDFELLFLLGATALFLALLTNLLAALSPVRVQPEGKSR